MSFGYYAQHGNSSGASGRMNKYWIIQKDIHRRIITTRAQEYLGRDTTVRSYTKDGEDGYLITTPGDFLTDDQIDEICIQSNDLWEQQAFDRFGNPPEFLKRPLHLPVVIYRATHPYSYGTGFPPYVAPQLPPPPPAVSPFVPPPHVSDARAARPGTPRNSSGSGRRHSSGHNHHSRHHRSYSASGSFSLPHASSTGSSLRWEPSSMQEEDMDDDESYPV